MTNKRHDSFYSKARWFNFTPAIVLVSSSFIMARFFPDINIGFSLILVIPGIFYALRSISLIGKDPPILHPYFNKKLSDKGESAFGGSNLALVIDEIDLRLEENNLPTISSFGYKDDQYNVNLDWHEPSAILPSLRYILQLDEDSVISAKVKKDVIKMISSIELAEECGALFCMHMRHLNAISGMELNMREGSYW